MAEKKFGAILLAAAALLFAIGIAGCSKKEVVHYDGLQQ